MEKRHRYALNRCRPQICDDVHVNDIVDVLISRQVIDVDIYESMYSLSRRAQVTYLLNYLVHRGGPHAFEALRISLSGRYSWLVQCLDESALDYVPEVSTSAQPLSSPPGSPSPPHHQLQHHEHGQQEVMVAGVCGVGDHSVSAALQQGAVPGLSRHSVLRHHLIDTLLARWRDGARQQTQQQTQQTHQTQQQSDDDIVLVHGMAGAGKSVLVIQALRSMSDDYMARHVPGGVFWLSLGSADCGPPGSTRTQEAEQLHAQTAALCVRLGAHPTAVCGAGSTLRCEAEVVRERLRCLLLARVAARGRCLLVLDDVWSWRAVRAFDLGICPLVVISRDCAVVDRVIDRVHVVQVKGFKWQETAELFARRLRVSHAQLPPEAQQIHAHSQGTPMVISLLCAYLLEKKLSRGGAEGGGTGGEGGSTLWLQHWRYIVDSMNRARFSKSVRKQYSYDYCSIWEAVDISVRSLDTELGTYFKQLCVFPQSGVCIPCQTLCWYWSLDMFEVENIMSSLTKKCLVREHHDEELQMMSYSLHNLIYDYLQTIYTDEQKCQLHARLLTNYMRVRTPPTHTSSSAGDPSVTDDYSQLSHSDGGYMLSHIAYHVRASGQMALMSRLYLDLMFVAAKLLAVGASGLLGDYSKYAVDIDANSECNRRKRRDYEHFVRAINHRVPPHTRRVLAPPSATARAVSLHTQQNTALSPHTSPGGIVDGGCGADYSNSSRNSSASQAVDGVRLLLQMALCQPSHSAVYRSAWRHVTNSTAARGRDTRKRTRSTSLLGWSLASLACSPSSLSSSASSSASSSRSSLSGAHIAAHSEYGAPIYLAWRNKELVCDQSVISTKVFASTVSCVLFTHHSDTVLTAYGDGHIRLWNVTTGDELVSFSGHQQPVTGMCLCAQADSFVSASEDGTLRVWSLQRALRIATGRQGAPNDMVCEMNSLHIRPVSHTRELHSSGDVTLKVVTAANTTRDDTLDFCLCTIQAHKSTVTCVDWSVDGRFLLSAGTDLFVKVWRLSGHTHLTLEQPHEKHAVLCCCFAPCGTYFATGAADTCVRVWTLAGVCVCVFGAHTQPVICVAFCGSDSGYLVSVAAKEIFHWNWLTTHKHRDEKLSLVGVSSVVEIKQHHVVYVEREHVTFRCAALTPDRTCLLVGTTSNLYHTWRLATRSLECVQRGFSGTVTCLALFASPPPASSRASCPAAITSMSSSQYSLSTLSSASLASSDGLRRVHTSPSISARPTYRVIVGSCENVAYTTFSLTSSEDFRSPEVSESTSGHSSGGNSSTNGGYLDTRLLRNYSSNRSFTPFFLTHFSAVFHYAAQKSTFVSDSADDVIVAAITSSNGIMILKGLDTAVCRKVPTIEHVCLLEFNEQGNQVAFACEDGTVGVFRLAAAGGGDGARKPVAADSVHVMGKHSRRVLCLRHGRDGCRGVVSGSEDSTMKVWWPQRNNSTCGATGCPVTHVDLFRSAVTCSEEHTQRSGADSCGHCARELQHYAISCCRDGIYRVYSVSSTTSTRLVSACCPHAGSAITCYRLRQLAPDVLANFLDSSQISPSVRETGQSPSPTISECDEGLVVFTSAVDGSVKMCRMRDGYELKAFWFEQGPVRTFQLSEDCSLIVTGHDNGAVMVAPTTRHELAATLCLQQPHCACVHDIYLSADATRLITLGTCVAWWSLSSQTAPNQIAIPRAASAHVLGRTTRTPLPTSPRLCAPLRRFLFYSRSRRQAVGDKSAPISASERAHQSAENSDSSSRIVLGAECIAARLEQVFHLRGCYARHLVVDRAGATFVTVDDAGILYVLSVV